MLHRALLAASTSLVVACTAAPPATPLVPSAAPTHSVTATTTPSTEPARTTSPTPKATAPATTSPPTPPPATAAESDWGQLTASQQPALADRFGTVQISAVAAHGPQVVAVGETVGVGPMAWYSADGYVWSKADRFAGPDGLVADVAAVDAGYLAVGTAGGNAAAWYSADGQKWQSAPVADGTGVSLHAVGAGRLGTFAIGGTDNGGLEQSSAWQSQDGRSWRRISGPNVFGDRSAAYSLAANDSTVVVVGQQFSGSWSATAWSSPDGIDWKSSGAIAAGNVDDAIATSDGFVGVGSAGSGLASPAAWTSADGLNWSQSSTVPGAGSNRDVWLASVALGGRGLVATGPSPEASVGVWTSADGVDWVRIPNVPGLAAPEEFEGTYEPTGIVAGGPGLVVVGSFPRMIPWLHMRDGSVWTNPAPPIAEPAPTASPAECPSNAKPAFIDVIYLSPSDRVRCFGDTKLTFVGYLMPTECGDAPPLGKPVWLAGPCGMQFAAIAADCCAASMEGFADPDHIKLDPEVLHGWFKFAGHFDDLRAKTCQAADPQMMTTEELVALCRSRFVITSMEPTTAP